MSAPADSLLTYENVSFCYPDGNAGLRDCSLAIRPGLRHALIGGNGAGKTTLFLHANGILKPQAGRVLYAGVPLDYGRDGLRQLRRQVGLVFQNPDQQLFSASVEEDVSFGPLNLDLDPVTVRERTRAALAAVGMGALAARPVHHLSFGQKKRVCIAGVLAMQPRLLILDEPMAGLDPAGRQELLAVFDALQAQGITLLLATHDMDFAYRWADQIHLLRDGQCLASLESAALAGQLETFARAGLPPPGVIELCQALTRLGWLEDDSPPRSLAALVAKLRAARANNRQATDLKGKNHE